MYEGDSMVTTMKLHVQVLSYSQTHFSIFNVVHCVQRRDGVILKLGERASNTTLATTAPADINHKTNLGYVALVSTPYPRPTPSSFLLIRMVTLGGADSTVAACSLSQVMVHLAEYGSMVTGYL